MLALNSIIITSLCVFTPPKYMILWFPRSTDRQDITIFPVCSTLIYSRYQKLVTLGQAALKCSICSKREKREKKVSTGAYFNIFASKMPWTGVRRNFCGEKNIFQPQLILIVTMQKIHNVDNDLLMFFPTGSNLFA